MNSKQLRKRREWLYSQNPHCPRCGVKMILPVAKTGKFSRRKNAATIEHLNNRYHLEKRHRPQSKEEAQENLKTRKGRTILLCLRCNGEIANTETKSLPIKELWQRSGRRKSNVVFIFFCKLGRRIFRYFIN